MIGLVREIARRIRIDQVERLWEPYMVLAARLREELGLPGLTVEETVPFRDKEQMKQLPTRPPAHPLARGRADSRGGLGGGRTGRLSPHRQARRRAGSADTYRADSAVEPMPSSR